MVQFETAHACAAPVSVGELLLERRDLGPLGDPARQDDALRGVGLGLAHHRLGDRQHRQRRRSWRHRLGAIVAHAHATSRRGRAGPRRGRSSPRSRAGHGPRDVSARRRGTGLTERSGPYSGARSEPITTQSAAASSFEAGLGAARDVEHVVGDVGLGGEHVGSGDVGGVHEVHRLRAVTEDHRCLAGDDALHPPDQHLGVLAVHVHARAVHVEVPRARRSRGRTCRCTSAADPR